MPAHVQADHHGHGPGGEQDAVLRLPGRPEVAAVLEQCSLVAVDLVPHLVQQRYVALRRVAQVEREAGGGERAPARWGEGREGGRSPPPPGAKTENARW